MSKILIYTDLHCAYTSSILPIHCNDSEYTTRLNMIVKTGKWIAETAKLENVDMIVNGGDTYDSHTLRSEEISAMSDFMSCFKDLSIPHIIIMGNHEELDVNARFTSTNALNNIDNVYVYNKPCKINNEVSVLPYMKSEDVTSSVLESIKNEFLISHIDIKGSNLRDTYIMDFGVNPELVAEYFTFTANGHLHTAEKIETTKNTVWNIGSCSSMSFVDNNEYIPSICIYDTKTKKLKRINNPHTILFRKYTVKSINELITYIKKLDKNYKYALRITCPFSIREELKSVIKELENVVAYRIVTTAISQNEHSSVKLECMTKKDMKLEFIKFLESNESVMNYPIDEYKKVMNELSD